MERWATFDCYGTLIDWNGGIRAELARVFGDDRADELVVRYHEVEPEVQRDTTLSYRQVMTDTMRLLGAPPGEVHGLAEALPAGVRSRRCTARSRKRAAAAGSSAFCRTPTTTTSPPRRCRSGSPSTR